MIVRNNSLLIKLLSFILLLLFWYILSSILNIETLPSPLKVFFKLQKDLSNGSLVYHLSITLYRVLVSFLLAMFIGVAIGILMGNNKKIDNILDSWNILFLNIPALVLIILSYVWLGLTELAAIIAVSLNKIPNVIVTVREGARAVNKELLQVAEIYRVSKLKKFTFAIHFYTS